VPNHSEEKRNGMTIRRRVGGAELRTEKRNQLKQHDCKKGAEKGAGL